MLELQKIATLLVMPYGLVALGLAGLWVLIIRHSRFATPWCFALLTLHLAAGADVVARRVHFQLERPYLDLQPLQQQPLDAVVLLGGATGETLDHTAQLALHGDRVALAARLYHAGLVKQLICTGVDFRARDERDLDPAQESAQLLTGLGVPPQAIEQVGGRTTQEEMQALAKLLPPGTRQGLVTSAWHMPRALRLARGSGLEFVPLPADFQTCPPAAPSVLDYLPNAQSAYRVSLGLKEWLAAVVGR
jgi:uncharacterized SAM-binding protein YcdF (DUF218 family)